MRRAVLCLGGHDFQVCLGEGLTGIEDTGNRLGLKEDEKRFIDSIRSRFQTCQETAGPGVEMVRGDELGAAAAVTAKTTPWKRDTGTATSEHRTAWHALRLLRPGTFRGPAASGAFCCQRVLSSCY